MITHFIRSAFRHLLKHRMHSVLNITGLTIAFSCVMLVSIFVRYEFSYDEGYENAENIYRVIQEDLEDEWRGTNLWNATSGLLKPAILSHCPEVMNGTRLLPIEEIEIVLDNQHFLDEKLYFVEPDFFEVFSHQFIHGNSTNAVNNPNSLVITESTASKYFPILENPVGKQIEISNISFTISGVIKDVPENSHLPINFLASYQSVFDPAYDFGDAEFEWFNNNFSTYVTLQEGIDANPLENKITATVKEVRGRNMPEAYHLQNIRDIHLHSHVNLEAGTNGNILYIYIFSGIALLLLVIAGFNYVNLTSAQLLFFTKETGIRKITGASKPQIFLQILGEAILISLVAFGCSLLVVNFVLHPFSQLVERQLTQDMVWNAGYLSWWFLTIILFAILTSLYPAFRILGLHPIQVLKSNKITSKESLKTRNSLAIIQFAISIALIACTIILYRQLDYVKNKELGFQKENIINIQIPDINIEQKKYYPALKNELSRLPDVLEVTYSQTALDKDNWGGSAQWAGKSPDVELPLYHLIVDENFLDFYGINLLYGQSFSPEMKAEGRSSYFILNEAAVKAIGWNDPINKKLSMQMWSDSRVIGVAEDFHYQPLHLGIEPLAISLGSPERHANIISVKIKSEQLSTTLNNIETVYSELFPEYPFNYHFLDEKLSESYRTDQKLGTMFGILAAISIVVACLGLFGLASFIARKRIKEIGIRKVNGAKVSEILTLLNKDFIRWVVIAFVIAVPSAWYGMNNWLENFAYKTAMSWWIYVLAGGIALVIALITVSWQSWKAATRNPVESLRYE